jgi:hypothetical protein
MMHHATTCFFVTQLDMSVLGVRGGPIHGLPMTWDVIGMSLILGFVLLALAWFAYRSVLRRELSTEVSFRGRRFWTAVVCFLIRFSAMAVVAWMLLGWVRQEFESEPSELQVWIDTSGSMTVNESGVGVNQDPSSVNRDSDSGPRDSRSAQAAGWLRSNFQTRAWDRWNKRHLFQFSLVDESILATDLEGVFERCLTETPATWNARSLRTSPLGDQIRSALQSSRQGGSGILFFTDGIVTSGWALSTAAEEARRRNMPLYFVGLGKQVSQPDLALVEIAGERRAFLGDSVLLYATVKRQDTDIDSVTLEVLDSEGKRIAQEILQFPESSDVAKSPIIIEAKSPGSLNLTLEVTSSLEETNTKNNRQEISIDVENAQIRVLLIQQYASYEYRFVKHLLERTRQKGNPDQPAFLVDTFLQDADRDYVGQDRNALPAIPVSVDGFKPYDAVVLMDVSPDLITNSIQNALTDYVARDAGGLLFVAGPRHMPSAFMNRPLSDLMPVQIQAPKGVTGPFYWSPTSAGTRIGPLQLSRQPDQQQELFESLPLGQLLMGGLLPKPTATILATSSETNEIVLATQYIGNGRVAFQATDETYLWQSYLGDDVYFQRYWNQMMRFLAAGRLAKQSDGTLKLSSQSIQVGQTVAVEATGIVATASSDGVAVRVEQIREDEEQRPLDRQFRLSLVEGESRMYSGELSGLSVGTYTVALDREQEQSDPNRTGLRLTVRPRNDELRDLESDEMAMREAAEISGGKFVWLEEADSLFAAIPPRTSSQLKPLPPRSLWNMPWLVVGLVTLLCGEWILRRSIGLN